MKFKIGDKVKYTGDDGIYSFVKRDYIYIIKDICTLGIIRFDLFKEGDDGELIKGSDYLYPSSLFILLEKKKTIKKII
jgi:hypothetical protein